MRFLSNGLSGNKSVVKDNELTRLGETPKTR